MKGYITDIEQRTEENDDFRRVLYTGPHMQLVLMTLEPGEDIGEEVHDVDQFFRIEEGKGVVSIDDTETPVTGDMAVLVPAGARHNIANTGYKPLRLYTIYAPPQHAERTVHHTKAEAQEAEEEFADEMTE